MTLKSARLRKGEVVAGVSGAALLVFLFTLHWFAAGASQIASTGWQALPVLRWLIVVTALAALALTVTQAALRTPALPVTLSVFVTVLGALTTVVLILRLLTTSSGLQIGAWLGLLGSIGIAVGGFLSLRQEGGWVPGPEHPVEIVSLAGSDQP